MKKELTLKEHLELAREKAHETQKKNGHYKKMQDIRLKKLKESK